MKKFSVLCLSILFVLVSAATVAAMPTTTLGFEDVGTASFGYIPDGYGNLSWDNFCYISSSGYKMEGDYSALNGGGNVACIISDEPITFQSALFKGAWNNGLNIQMTAYSQDGFSVFQDTIIVDTVVPFLFSSGWDNIFALSFCSFGGVDAGLSGSGIQFGMDEFTFSSANNAAPVPEPATIFLFGSGVLGIVGLRNRQKKKRA